MAKSGVGAGSLLSAGASLFSGISSYMSGMDSASLLEEQGALSQDDYYRQAALTVEKGSRLRSKQTMEYISAGVEIAGTPQLMLKETLSKSRVEAAALRTTGDNVRRLYNRKAEIQENESRSSLIGGILIAGALLL